MTTDAQYIQQTLSGDAEAYGHLVRRHQDRLFHAFCRITNSREEAEDVVQEALVQGFVRLDSFQHRSTFYTWLYRIAMNISISRQRRRRPLRSSDIHSEYIDNDPIDPAEPADRSMERRENIVALHQALATLSDEHRSILVLREIDELDYEAIGEILDLPLGTVRSRLHRARLQLREALEASFPSVSHAPAPGDVTES